MIFSMSYNPPRKRVRLDPALLQENDSDDEFEQILDDWIPEEHTDDDTKVSDYNTDSEEEMSDEEDETHKEVTFYMGKDGTTKWTENPTDFGSRRMNMANVIKSTPNKRPGGLQTGVEWFELFFDSVVINKIVNHIGCSLPHHFLISGTSVLAVFPQKIHAVIPQKKIYLILLI